MKNDIKITQFKWKIIYNTKTIWKTKDKFKKFEYLLIFIFNFKPFNYFIQHIYYVKFIV